MTHPDPAKYLQALEREVEAWREWHFADTNSGTELEDPGDPKANNEWTTVEQARAATDHVRKELSACSAGGGAGSLGTQPGGLGTQTTSTVPGAPTADVVANSADPSGAGLREAAQRACMACVEIGAMHAVPPYAMKVVQEISDTLRTALTQPPAKAPAERAIDFDKLLTAWQDEHCRFYPHAQRPEHALDFAIWLRNRQYDKLGIHQCQACQRWSDEKEPACPYCALRAKLESAEAAARGAGA